jgi:hypothetical protein
MNIRSAFDRCVNQVIITMVRHTRQRCIHREVRTARDLRRAIVQEYLHALAAHDGPDIAGIWPRSPGSIRNLARGSSTAGLRPDRVILGESVRHRRPTLQQSALPKSHINGNRGKDIPELTRWSGIIGTRSILIYHDQRSRR